MGIVQIHGASEAPKQFDVFPGAVWRVAEFPQEIHDCIRYCAVIAGNLNRGFLCAVPITMCRYVPPVDGDPWNVCEGVELFGLCGVVHGWNKIGFFGKLDESAIGVDLVCELARCPRHRVIHDGGVHVVAVFESVGFPFESLDR